MNSNRLKNEQPLKINKKKLFTKTANLAALGLLLLGSVPMIGGVPKKVEAATSTSSTVPVSSGTPLIKTTPDRPQLPVAPTMVDALGPTQVGVQYGIKELLKPLTVAQTTSIVVIVGQVAVYTYPATHDGLYQALYAIYNDSKVKQTSPSDYLLYLGGNINMGGNAVSNVDRTSPSSNPGTTGDKGMNFHSFNKNITPNVKSITLTSNVNDSFSSTPSSTSYIIGIPHSIYLGAPTVFRNINYKDVTNSEDSTAVGSMFNMYGQGNPIVMGQGANALDVGKSFVYQILGGTGGSTSSKMSPGTTGTNVYLSSLTTALSNVSMRIVGGGDNNIPITGDIHVTLNEKVSRSSTIDNLVGGSVSGSVDGSIYLNIINSTGFIQHIAGGGGTGGTTSVTGNVVNHVESSSANAVYQTFQGGTKTNSGVTGYSDIGGAVYNYFKGKGAWSDPLGSHFVGGSWHGNIGGKNGVAVVNDFDTSSFSNNGAWFTGGNGRIYLANSTASGIINGSITNYIKSGTTTGIVNGISGGMGWGGNTGNASDINSVLPATKGYIPNQMDIDKIANNTLSDSGIVNATVNTPSNGYMAITGDVYTWEKGGTMSYTSSNSFGKAATIGAGYGGYVRGNVTVEIGGKPDDNLDNRTVSIKNPSGFITAGGGTLNSAGEASDATGSMAYFWLTGNSTVVINNLSTPAGNSSTGGVNIYGGNSGGFQQGNSAVITDPNTTVTGEASLFGGGQFVNLQLGDSEVDVHGGKFVDITAGGYASKGQVGNAQAFMDGGILGGGTQGYVGSLGSWITGSTNLQITGGDLSQTFGTSFGGTYSAGVSASKAQTANTGGTIKGDSTFTLTFSSAMPAIPSSKNTISAAGSTWGGNSVSGGTLGNATVNITDTAGTHITGGTMKVWGDSSSLAQSNPSSLKKVSVNINAPTDTFDTVAATAYPIAKLTTGHSIPVEHYIQSSGKIGTINGGGYTDTVAPAKTAEDFKSTNTFVSGNTTGSQITFGNGYTQDTNLVENFTSMTIGSGTTLNPSGSVLNGSGATAATHGNSYSNFGDITMQNGSKLVVPSTTALVSASKLTAQGNVTLSSPYEKTAGRVNLSDFDASAGSLQWAPTGTQPTLVDPTNTANVNPSAVYDGYYNGKQMGYVVLTFTGGNSATGVTKIKEPSVTSAYDPTTQAAAAASNFYTTATDVNGAMFGDYDATSYKTSGLTETGNVPTYLAVISPQGTQSFTGPDTFDFGKYVVTDDVKTASIYTGSLTTEDTRFSKWAAANPLNVTVSATTFKNPAGRDLSNYNLYYQNAAGKQTAVTSSANNIASANGSKWGYQNISKDENWINKNSSTNGSTITGSGLNFTIPGNQALTTAYTGTLTWTVANNVPSTITTVK